MVQKKSKYIFQNVLYNSQLVLEAEGIRLRLRVNLILNSKFMIKFQI